ncbi:MAG: TusE/DsrC/DsvC family sulfur relay protein [Pseudomonadales bacterium]|nr:TusE/DsrC/DsvC family sulfur relay protein [Pseudomonadales bacterium]MDG1441267.1 TusE/DsrC/DsvC family sulfur relay protein [Pseudomonadales bacterium]
MEPQLDKEGFLTQLSQWNESVAANIANQEGIELTANHWQVLHLIRDFYIQYDLSPTTRVLVKIVKDNLGEDKGNSIYLMGLFTGKPAKLAAKIAGLPKPANCD